MKNFGKLCHYTASLSAKDLTLLLLFLFGAETILLLKADHSLHFIGPSFGDIANKAMLVYCYLVGLVLIVLLNGIGWSTLVDKKPKGVYSFMTLPMSRYAHIISRWLTYFGWLVLFTALQLLFFILAYHALNQPVPMEQGYATGVEVLQQAGLTAAPRFGTNGLLYFFGSSFFMQLLLPREPATALSLVSLLSFLAAVPLAFDRPSGRRTSAGTFGFILCFQFLSKLLQDRHLGMGAFWLYNLAFWVITLVIFVFAWLDAKRNNVI